MPFTLSTLVSGRSNRFSSRSPTSPASQRKLYFCPGGHTHDRHTVPPDQLHISFSDPVLVAAEEWLSNISNEQRHSKFPAAKDATASTPDKLGSAVLHLKGGCLSQSSGDDNDVALVSQAVEPLMMPTNTQGTSLEHCWKAGFQGAATHGTGLLDPLDDSCDISEVMTIVSVIDCSPRNADSSASENNRNGSDLAPLASKVFKEELYNRGYLKRPTSRPSNVVPRKPRTSLAFVSRKIFPKVLGRRQGRKVAECLREGQVNSLADTAGGLDAQFSEKHPSTSLARVTLRTPRADGLESPRTDTNTSASESFDLHEFSYITAFTTPPSSPSPVDVETSAKGEDLGDSKHAV